MHLVLHLLLVLVIHRVFLLVRVSSHLGNKHRHARKVGIVLFPARAAVEEDCCVGSFYALQLTTSSSSTTGCSGLVCFSRCWAGAAGPSSSSTTSSSSSSAFLCCGCSSSASSNSSSPWLLGSSSGSSSPSTPPCGKKNHSGRVRWDWDDERWRKSGRCDKCKWTAERRINNWQNINERVS